MEIPNSLERHILSNVSGQFVQGGNRNMTLYGASKIYLRFSSEREIYPTILSCAYKKDNVKS